MAITRCACNSVAISLIGGDAELTGDEVQHRFRDDLARLDQTAGIAKGTELKSEADLIGSTLAAFDQSEIGIAEDAMP